MIEDDDNPTHTAVLFKESFSFTSKRAVRHGIRGHDARVHPTRSICQHLRQERVVFFEFGIDPVFRVSYS